MVEYVYERPKSHKILYLMIITTVILVSLFLVYTQLDNISFTVTMSEAQCSEKLTEWCNYCNSAIKSSGFIESSEPQKTAEKDVIECSNLYFDSGWAEDQSCTGTLNFCSGFMQRN
jgi:tRNA(His) 5'-end guanylyltransferase